MNTGAQANVLPLSIYNQLNIRPILTETNVKVSAYNGGSIPTVGQCELNLENKNENYQVTFIVTDSKSPPLLGLQTCQQLNIINRRWAVNTSEPNLMEQYEPKRTCLVKSDVYRESIISAQIPMSNHSYIHPEKFLSQCWINPKQS